jgi:hypothetical protein
MSPDAAGSPDPSADGGAWHAALAYALVGEEWSLDRRPGPDLPALAVELAARDWTRERIAVHARSVQESGRPWPHPIPDALRAGLGAAQLYAALGRAREELGVAVLDPRAPSGRTVLTADERRLLADVPPHHVAR